MPIGFIEIEHNFRTVAPISHADDVVDLHFTAGPDTQIAMDTGIKVDPHSGMTRIRGGQFAPREAAAGNSHALGPLPELGIVLMRNLALRLIGNQEFHDQSLRRAGARIVRRHVHPRARGTNTGGGKHPLAFNFDHTGSAIAVRPVTRFR